jgi:rhamnosyltransferase
MNNSLYLGQKKINFEQNSVPRVVIFLTVYNGIQWLPEQLDSLLAQINISLTIVVSVDQSSDGSEEWIDQRAFLDDRIVVLPHGERFGGAAENFFRIIREFDFQGYDYIAFSDQDDIWIENKLLLAHSMMVATGADGYSSNVFAFWDNGRTKLINKSQPQVQWDFLFESPGPGCTFLMKFELMNEFKDLIIKREKDVSNIGKGQHDWLIYAFARANGYRWIIDANPGMFYRQHQKNQVGVNVGLNAFVYRVKKVLSGWGLRQSALIANLVGVGDQLFVKQWSQRGNVGIFWLTFQARKCRRRLRDQFIFAGACIVLSIISSKN